MFLAVVSMLLLTCFHYNGEKHSENEQIDAISQVPVSTILTGAAWIMNVTSPFRSLTHSADAVVTSPSHNGIQPSFPSLFALISRSL